MTKKKYTMTDNPNKVSNDGTEHVDENKHQQSDGVAYITQASENKAENNSAEICREDSGGDQEVEIFADTYEGKQLVTARRQQALLADGMLMLQEENRQLKLQVESLKNDLTKAKEGISRSELTISHLRTDVINDKQEKYALQKNLKLYQQALDRSELENEMTRKLSPCPSPRSLTPNPSPRLQSAAQKRMSKGKLKKKDISRPTENSYLHVSGAKMINSKLTIVDNTGLLDPRVRKYLALAGITESSVVGDPSKMMKLEKFAQEENLLEQMDHRRDLKRQRTMTMLSNLPNPEDEIDGLVKLAYAPEPPPLPPPPIVMTNAIKIVKSDKPSEKAGSPGQNDIFQIIRSGSFSLKPVNRDLDSRPMKSLGSEDELLNALRGALSKIEDAAGFSSDEEDILDDW